jgi:hypothetical protein
MKRCATFVEGAMAALVLWGSWSLSAEAQAMQDYGVLALSPTDRYAFYGTATTPGYAYGV